METGAIGWKFQDEMLPVLDGYDRQMEDIKRNGAEGQLARMQAHDDVRAAATLPAGANQPDGSWYNPFGGIPDNASQSVPYIPVSTDAADRRKLFEGIADAFGNTGFLADSASTGATYLGRALGGGETAALHGLEGVTRRFISAPLSAAEGIANTFRDVEDGYTPAESILGNILRSSMVYGGGAMAGMATTPLGGAPGIAAGVALDSVLPSGGTMGRSLLHPPASKYDFPTTVMLRAK